MYEKYRDNDSVVFLGLTLEDATTLEESRRFVEETEMSWPNGYGAGETLNGFDLQALPSIWVVGRDGKVVWNHDSPGDLEEGIEQALAADL